MPSRAPIDELVRVEQHHTQHDRERDDRHRAKVPAERATGLVSDAVFSPEAGAPASVALGQSGAVDAASAFTSDAAVSSPPDVSSPDGGTVESASHPLNGPALVGIEGDVSAAADVVLAYRGVASAARADDDKSAARGIRPHMSDDVGSSTRLRKTARPRSAADADGGASSGASSAANGSRAGSPQVSSGLAGHAGDEDACVARAAAGDADAFRVLFLRHRGAVARLVYRMLNGPADLDDVVQEVFVQVFRSLKDFRGQAKLTTWLHRIAVNVVLMHRRSARSRPVLTDELPGELVVDEHQRLPDEDVDRRDRMRAFQRLLGRLADKKRIVFVLHELEGMSPGEIAEAVGAPVLTVRTRLFYARRELEAMLAEEPTLARLAQSLAEDSKEDDR